MALSAGFRLGPYEIQSLIGSGGMGEVYTARDTRLDRTVALKVLATADAGDPTRRARFESEARTIAQLTHPHICTLYDVGSHDEVTYLVMEHLAGETLAGRLRKGPLPVAQVLEIGAQIADALDAAHKAGIVHRDLKPSNVMLVGRGSSGSARAGGDTLTVKLLDFGLAKLRAHGEAPAVTLAAERPDATETTLTAPGTIVGTLPYMAPEQVQGQETDARTDLWALGAILYEMLTGARAFDAPSATGLIGAILEREPQPISTRQPLTPPSLERVVRRCLAKHPDDRWDTALDLADELRWIEQNASSSDASMPPAGHARWRRARFIAAALAITVLAGSAGAWLQRRLASSRESASRPVVRTLVDVAPAERLDGGSWWEFTPAGQRTAFTWTPDGKTLVFVGRTGKTTQLFVRALDSPRARAIPGTDGAMVPAVTADGRLVAFWSNGAIRKVPLAGGPVELVVNAAQAPAGMAWAADGTLFYDKMDAILQIDRAGTVTTVMTKRERPEHLQLLPLVLPGDRVLLYSERWRGLTWGGEAIVAHVRATGERKVLVRDATDARYLASGHLLFLRRGVLFAVPFDAERVEIRGQPVAVLADVVQALEGGNTEETTGAGQFAVSSAGALAWVHGAAPPLREGHLVAVDRHGAETTLPAPARPYWLSVRVSPDGTRLAVHNKTLTEISLWIYDLVRGTVSPVVTEGEATWPEWTPDGRRLVYEWNTSDGIALVSQPSDGGPGRETLQKGDLTPASWSRDGRHFVVIHALREVMRGALHGPRLSLEPVFPASAAQSGATLSPDGRVLAYEDHGAGQIAVYVQPYPGPGPRVQVSQGFGMSPAWNSNGRELYYLTGATKGEAMMAVSIDQGASLVVGRPRVLFERNEWNGGNPVRSYDVAPDGQRFYFVSGLLPPEPPPVTHIAIVQNWVEELKAKVPTGH